MNKRTQEWRGKANLEIKDFHDIMLSYYYHCRLPVNYIVVGVGTGKKTDYTNFTVNSVKPTYKWHNNNNIKKQNQLSMYYHWLFIVNDIIQLQINNKYIINKPKYLW